MDMSNPKILIADDSLTIRLQIGRILQGADYQTVFAKDGVEAIDLIFQEKPSLMILDVNMPGLDGFGVCEILKQLGPQCRQLPIIFLTSMRSNALELLGGEFGDYLQKPVADQRLLEAVEKQLVLKCS